LFLGVEALGGLLAGALVVGVLLAILPRMHRKEGSHINHI